MIGLDQATAEATSPDDPLMVSIAWAVLLVTCAIGIAGWLVPLARERWLRWRTERAADRHTRDWLRARRALAETARTEGLER